MKRRVLLVEDSPTQARRLRDFLEADGLEVVHVPTAEAALEQLQLTGADLIVLDFHLPGMNGDEFCREIRMNVNTRAVPVLMLTVEGSEAAELHGLDSGADDYLAKSADPTVLRVRVHALLRKSQGTAPILDVEKRFSRARVLAIDDSPTYLFLLESELKAEHYIVETTTSPLRGLELMEEKPFDCVLVDYEMPALNGPDVCRRIRANRGESEPEVVLIMLTSHEDKEHMSEGFEAGADDYIAKSADLAITKARMRALLRRKFLVEENRHILNELREKELRAIRAKAEKESAELRALVADRLALANRELEIANRKLDLANKELEQFAYAAAHDLQEPLRMVGAYSQLLQMDYGSVLDERATEYLTHCVEGVKRMAELIRDLLTYARATMAEDQRTDLVDLNSALENAMAHVRAAIIESGAEVTHDPLPRLWVEEIRIQQLLQNLLGNAIKYRDPSRSPRVHVGVEKTGEEWRFVVVDNGIGIKPEHQDQVFAAFKRLHKSASAGTGLGLAICQRIVQHYGGRIWVDSEPGCGSRFYFTLPARLEAPVSGASHSAP